MPHPVPSLRRSSVASALSWCSVTSIVLTDQLSLRMVHFALVNTHLEKCRWAKVPRVHPRKQVLACPVAVAELAVHVAASRPDAIPARQRHRVIPGRPRARRASPRTPPAPAASAAACPANRRAPAGPRRRGRRSRSLRGAHGAARCEFVPHASTMRHHLFAAHARGC